MNDAMSTFWIDFLTKQIPVIIVMGLGIWWQNKYFVGVMEKKDEIIEGKDEEIKLLNEKLVTITTNCINAFNRNSEVLQDVKDLVKELKKDL